MSEFSNHVAIVGFACRYPGAPDADAYWRLIRDGVESLQQFTEDELRADGVPDFVLGDPNYVKAGSVLEGHDRFDAPFFGYSPREGSLIDPQQRLFLETAWKAFEHAGYDPSRYGGRIGVFAGTDLSEYLLNNLLPRRREFETVFGYHVVLLGNETDSLPTRVSYKLNLRGPSMAVSTHCSTSLVATAVAWQSLIDYQCDMALAGGAHCAPGKRGHMYVSGAIFSPDASCRPFDAKAQGTRLSPGVGAVILKRVEDALADGDTIYAVIRGAAVNHDGSAKIGFTAPGIAGQSEVITEAMAIAEVEPDTIQYVETHGTATPLGDPVEVKALTRAYRTGTDRTQYCALGGVKANIGHTTAAAGVAGLIKTALCLHHRTLPPLINFESPNPEIELESSPFYINTELRPWEGPGPRRAAVSSFGMGGTNAHVILEEAPQTEAPTASRRPAQLLVLSAKTEGSLQRSTDALAHHLREHPEQSLAHVSYTLAVGRAQLPHRRAVVAASGAEAADALERGAFAGARAAERSLALLLPGAARFRRGILTSLLETETPLRDTIDTCAQALRDVLAIDLRAEVARAPAGDRPEGVARVEHFVLGLALSRVLDAWGVKPAAIVGWGAGELAAACVAGLLSPEEALTLLGQSVGGRLTGPIAPRAAQADDAPSVPVYVRGGGRLTPEQARDLSYWSERLLGPEPEGDPWSPLRDAGLEGWAGLELGARVTSEVAQGDLFASCAAEGAAPGADAVALMAAIGSLWTQGVEIGWDRFFASEPRRRVALPTYSFDPLRCWIDPPQGAAPQAEGSSSRGVRTVAPPRAIRTDADGWRGPGSGDGTPGFERQVPYVEPTTEMEREIAAMWEEILDVRPIGLDDSFLALGGDSLLISRLMTRVRELYGIEVTVQMLMEGNTLRDMARIVARELIKDAGEDNLAELLAEMEAGGGVDDDDE